ncbi:zinc finger, CCHC-type containing protein [Tanacetum coccineum]
MDTSEKLMPNNGQAVSQLEYSRMIGCLRYAMTCTRPDIAFAVGKLSMYTSNPSTQYWHAIQRVLKYLKKNINYRLTYTGYPLVLEGYTNTSWISNTEDNSSTSGWVFLLGGGAISWASKKQTCITGSTMKSIFVALAAAGKEAEWLKNLFLEISLWSKPITPISIRYDNAATLAKAYSQMYNEKFRHLGVRHNMILRHSMIRELIQNGVISIEFVRYQQNLADHLMKGLARDLVIKFDEGIGLNMNVEYLYLTTPFLEMVGNNATLEQIRKSGQGGHDDYVSDVLILMVITLKQTQGGAITLVEVWAVIYALTGVPFRCRIVTAKRQHMFAGPTVVNLCVYVAWWVDSGATVHVCKDRCWFKTYESLNDGSILHMENESTALVHGRGCVDLRFSSGKIVLLFNVLHDDPKTFDEAMKSQDFASLKMKQLMMRWTPLWVDGTIEKFKARLVIQGFKQKSGIDYFDIYALVARISTIRLLIAMASIYNIIIHQMDMKTAFLNGDLDEEVDADKREFLSSRFSMKDIGKEAEMVEDLVPWIFMPIIDGKVTLMDDEGKPFAKIDFVDDHDNDDEVASVNNDMANFLASNKGGYCTNSLLEQWKGTYENDDYDFDPYDDDMYEGHDIPEKIQAICDNLDIKVHGRKKK